MHELISSDLSFAYVCPPTIINGQEEADNNLISLALAAEGGTTVHNSLDAVVSNNVALAQSTSSSTLSRSRAQRLNLVYMQMEAVRNEVRDGLSRCRNPSTSEVTAELGADAVGAAADQQPWEVVELLGKGSSGEVFKCKWRGLTVAIKQIKFQVRI